MGQQQQGRQHLPQRGQVLQASNKPKHQFPSLQVCIKTMTRKGYFDWNQSPPSVKINNKRFTRACSTNMGKTNFVPIWDPVEVYNESILEYLPGYIIIIIISVRTASLSHDVYYQSLLLTSANLHVHTQNPFIFNVLNLSLHICIHLRYCHNQSSTHAHHFQNFIFTTFYILAVFWFLSLEGILLDGGAIVLAMRSLTS